MSSQDGGGGAERPYDYRTRCGVLPISWEDFHGICKALAQAGASWQSELVLAVGRGGYYPGSLIAHLLRIDIHPVRVSRRINDVVVYQEPRWVVEPPLLIRGRKVLIVDEICSSGQTLSIVGQRAATLGAQQVKSAVLYAHTWGPRRPTRSGSLRMHSCSIPGTARSCTMGCSSSTPSTPRPSDFRGAAQIARC